MTPHLRHFALAISVLVVASCTTGQSGGETTPPGGGDTTPPSVLSSTTSTKVPDDETTTTAPITTTTTIPPENLTIESFPVPAGSRPHDVAPAADGGIWYTAQGSGELGWLDPATGETRHVPLGTGSRPHGVIVDGDGTPWVTDGGLNAIVSVDPGSNDVTIYPLPDADAANLNTAVFDEEGRLWFTGQAGIFGYLEIDTGETVSFQAPRGRGPYGIAVNATDTVVFASLAGSYVGEITDDGEVIVHEPPTAAQGARRVWADSDGAFWVSEWNSGNVSRLDLDTGEWDTWPLPGDASTYALYVDDEDVVWLSDFTANALVRFDPVDETFHVYPLPHEPGDVRQIHGRPGEVWGAESAADHLVVIRTR